MFSGRRLCTLSCLLIHFQVALNAFPLVCGCHHPLGPSSHQPNTYLELPDLVTRECHMQFRRSGGLNNGDVFLDVLQLVPETSLPAPVGSAWVSNDHLLARVCEWGGLFFSRGC